MINLDKVYTDSKGLEFVNRILVNSLDLNSYSSIIDPCAGEGAFKTIIPVTQQYDISPDSKDIIKSNFFDINLEFDINRLMICSPPFGDDRGYKFLNHASKMGSCVAAIVSRKIEAENFIDGFDLIKKKEFKDKCFNKNGIDIELKHLFCIWVKRV